MFFALYRVPLLQNLSFHDGTVTVSRFSDHFLVQTLCSNAYFRVLFCSCVFLQNDFSDFTTFRESVLSGHVSFTVMWECRNKEGLTSLPSKVGPVMPDWTGCSVTTPVFQTDRMKAVCSSNVSPTP
jgi:hypothetical protein